MANYANYNEARDEAAAALNLIPFEDLPGFFVIPYIKDILKFYKNQMFHFKRIEPGKGTQLQNSMFIMRNEKVGDEGDTVLETYRQNTRPLKMIRLVDNQLILFFDSNEDGTTFTITENEFAEYDKRWFIPFRLILKYMLVYPES